MLYSNIDKEIKSINEALNRLETRMLDMRREIENLRQSIQDMKLVTNKLSKDRNANDHR